jgi:amino acid permease
MSNKKPLADDYLSPVYDKTPLLSGVSGVVHDDEHSANGDAMAVDRSQLQSPIHVFFNIFKAVVGAGSFALPLAFKNGGIWGSLVGLVVLGLMSDYTIKTMIRTKDHMRHRGSYPELVAAGLPGRVGVVVSKLVYGAIVLTVLGVCTVYLVFCGKLIQNLLSLHCYNVIAPISVMGSFLAVVSWLPSLKKISFLSLIGDGALLIAMLCVVIYGFHFFEFQPLDSYPQFPIESYMGFYGPVVFLYAIHMLVIPLHNEMANPALFERTLDVSLIVVVLSNGAFAMLAFLLFNKHIPEKDPITSALTDNWGHLNKVVDVALILDLTFTFTVIFVAGRDVIEQSLGWIEPSMKTHWKRMVLRSFMVALCTLCAIVLHDFFSVLVDFIAGLTMSPLCFILPPLLYLVNLWPHEYRNALHGKGGSVAWLLVACGINVGIIMIGTGTTIYSTVGSVTEIVNAFHTKEVACDDSMFNMTFTSTNVTTTLAANLTSMIGTAATTTI